MAHVKKIVKSILRTPAAIWIASAVGVALVRLVQALSPTEYRNIGRLQQYVGRGKPVIIVFWHSRGLFMMKIWRQKIGIRRHPICGVFSTHRDGRVMGNIYRWLGVRNVMSAKRSAASAKEVAFKLVKALKSGVSVGITPDGPLGPAKTFVTDSVFLFSKMTGAPIVPLYISASRAKFLRTWDRYMLIRPFSRSVIEAGDFVFVPERADRAEIARIRGELTRVMTAESDRLDREMGARPE
ncbi:MAG: DUF374 domain-containing protein [Rickettsiales bacterium]|jgi:lysophospholipid acyltransferase (LPLAT)-like uncharacterized protein|nr:DUF374 domain-containing protein [Rickettsiales bacterium]